MRTPASIYGNSPRPFPERLPEPEYGSAVKVRRVMQHGQFFWDYNAVFLGKALAGERIGLIAIDDRCQRICLGRHALARFDTHTLRVEKLRPEDYLDDA